jgi:hypothetical protein
MFPRAGSIAVVLGIVAVLGRCTSEKEPVDLSVSPVQTEQVTIIGQDDESPDPSNEDTGIVVSEDSLLTFTSNSLYGTGLNKTKWSEDTHDNYVYLCAIKSGISPARAATMRDAAHMPDVFQSGIDNLYNQQWSHAYIVTKTFWGAQWIWGDADDDFHDNIDGSSGETESPEGYNGKWAGYYYQQGNQNLGDWYLGYACHFIADVSFVLHTTFPDVDMALHHSDYETWVKNNWTAGHNFSSVANEIPASSFYAISDLKSAIRSASKGSNYTYSSNAKNAWDNYQASGFPTGAGTGNVNAVYYTKKMVEESTKWTGGAIKYTLNRYSQW